MTLDARQIHFEYQHDKPVLRDVSVSIIPGKITGLWGPNGCGKSTLLNCLNANLSAKSGEVILDDVPLIDLSAKEIAQHIAVVRQDVPADIPLTVEQFLLLGRFPFMQPLSSENERDLSIVKQCAQRMNIENLLDRIYAQLSGGERQRVALARALVQQPAYLLLDEPANHLDMSHQIATYKMLRQLATQGVGVLMVCHDLLLAPMFVDDALLMHQGSIAATGAVQSVLSQVKLKEVFGMDASVEWNEQMSLAARFF